MSTLILFRKCPAVNRRTSIGCEPTTPERGDTGGADMSKFGIGQAVRRVEDRRFLTGTGSFVGDMALPRQCYGVPVLSPHAHARIKRVDIAAARAAPGVLAVLTGADAAADKIGGIPPYFMPEAWGGPKGYATVRPVLLCRPRALRRRPRGLRGGRDRSAGARCSRAGRGRLRGAASRDRRGGRGQGRRAADLGRLPERQHRRDDRVRRQGGDRCRLRKGEARRVVAAGEQSHHRQPDRAALRDRLIQRRGRQVHALHDIAGPARRAHARSRSPSSTYRKPKSM